MLQYAMSNIAWSFADRLEVYPALRNAGINGLEIAPGMLFADCADAFAPPIDILRARKSEIAAAGLTLVSMQSLLFGVKDVALFGTSPQRQDYIGALKRAISLAAELDIPHLVLGSPRERNIPADMPDLIAEEIALDAFTTLADYAKSAGCRIGLEPNPSIYNTNFATTLDSAQQIVTKLAHPAFCLTLDIGAVLVNEELPLLDGFLQKNRDMIGHVHLSEPHLKPAPADSKITARILASLKEAGYKKWVSIEMRQPDGGIQELSQSHTRLKAAREYIG